MSDYVKATNFYSKDALLTGDPDKIIKGAEIDDEFNAIATAISTKANSNSPNFTGTPTVPTAPAITNTTQAASTAFVKTAIDNAQSNANITGGTIDNVAITDGTISSLDTPLEVASGGTGAATLTGVVIGNGISAMTAVAPGSNGNVLRSDGTVWQSVALAGGIGDGQTWQNVTSSRASDVNYTNNTGKPIQVMITTYKIGSSAPTYFYVGSVLIGYTDGTGTNDVGQTSTTSFIVPDGSTYKASGDLQQWAELR